MESDENDFAQSRVQFASPKQAQVSDSMGQGQGRGKGRSRGKAKEWKKSKMCMTEAEVEDWLKHDQDGQSWWVKDKRHVTQEGIKQYMTCKHTGCHAEMKIWYHVDSVQASIFEHGDHDHETDHQTRGLSATVKKVRTTIP